ncbi:MAG: radical SAM protein [Candidatus Verstraetearchaeota archaeon]|nr:radical SAM protein [Candidatus Verstraetearchaeota archaeon]
MIEVKAIPCKSALSRSALPGLMYAFNPYVGCQHGCLYCYVPDVLKGRVSSSEWGGEVLVKEGVLDHLRADLKRLRPGAVGVSTVTDPYQPVERSLGITREALSMLKDAEFPVSVQTKSPLVLRDLDIMKGDNFEVGMTITSMDDAFRRCFEPGAPPPEERVHALEEASSKGVRTWIFYGPVIPGFNDSPEEIESITGLAQRTRSRILYDRLNIKPMMLTRIGRILSVNDILSIRRGTLERTFRTLEDTCKRRGVRCDSAF